MKIHGGNIYQYQQMLDFSANINPLGMPDAVRSAVMQSAPAWVCYPDPDCTELTGRLAEAERISPAQIVCGNGAADLIYRIVHAFRPHRAVIPVPAFSEYLFALNGIGCEITEFPLHAAADYSLNEDFLSALSDETDIVFLCTPNNPTGRLIPPELLRRIAEACRKRNILLVCDECFLRFCADAAQYSLRPYLTENCIILNAFTKLYAMPGLRLGYALCGSEQIAGTLRGTGQYWSVSVPAQAAGAAALQIPEWIPESVRYVRDERAFLSDTLRDSGIFVYDGAANFLLMKAPADFADRMERHRILVRRCADFHCLTDEHFRIAVRTHDENLALIAAVREEYKCQEQL